MKELGRANFDSGRPWNMEACGEVEVINGICHREWEEHEKKEQSAKYYQVTGFRILVVGLVWNVGVQFLQEVIVGAQFFQELSTYMTTSTNVLINVT